MDTLNLTIGTCCVTSPSGRKVDVHYPIYSLAKNMHVDAQFEVHS